MPPTRLRSQIIGDGDVLREDINIVTPGQALITRLLNGGDFSFTSTGADSGTGDVTLLLATTGITAGEYAVATFDNKGRATGGRALAVSDLPVAGIGTGTGIKFTYDNYGRITAVGSLAAGDIPSGSTFYVQNQSGSAQTASAWVTGFLGALGLRAYNGAGTFYTELTAPAALAANRVFALPATYGASGDVLVGDGAGAMSWTNLSSTYVPVAGTSTVTGLKTFSGGLEASSLTVTGTTTLATSITGLLKATSGVVAAATAADVSGIVYADYAALLTAIPSPSVGQRALIAGGGILEYTASGWLGHIGVFANVAALPGSGVAPGSRVSVLADGTDYFYASSGTPHSAVFLDVAQTFTALQTFGAGLTVVGTTTLSTSLTGILRATSGVVSTQAVGNLTETGSSVLSITGGTGALIGSGASIQVSQATTSTSGYLSSTDWNTFNSKQNAITDPVTGTGTASYVTRWSSGTEVTGDVGLITAQTSGKTFALVLGGSSASPPSASMAYYVNGQPGYSKELVFQTTGARRWSITVTSAAESGSNAGSTFRILAYVDGGTLLDIPVEITRASAGAIALGGSTLRPVNLSGALNVTGATTLTGALSGTSATFSSLTSGRVPVTTTAGLLTDYASFTFNPSGGQVLTVGDGTSATARVDINGSAGSTVALRMRQASILRWAPIIDGTTTRFQIVAYDAAGVEVDRPLEIQNGSGGNIYLNRPTLVSTLTATQVVYAGTSGLLSSDAGFNTTQASGITRALSIGDYATANDVLYVARQTSGQLAGYTMNDSAANRRWAVVIAGTDYRVGRWTNSSTKVDDPIIIVAGSAGAITIGGSTASPVSFTGTIATTGLATLAQATVSDVTATHVMFAGTAGRITGHSGLTYDSGTGTLTAVSTQMRLTNTAGVDRLFYFTTSGALRAAVGVTNAAESGSDTGSNFVIRMRNDAGSAIDDPMTIVRASAGLITIGGASARPTTFTGVVKTQSSAFAQLELGKSGTGGVIAFARPTDGVLGSYVGYQAAGSNEDFRTSVVSSNDVYITWHLRNAANLSGREVMRLHNSGGLSVGSVTDPGVGGLLVTGTTTLATSLGGLLKATAGVVSAATAADVTGYALTGFTVGSNTAIVAGDSILAAFGKTQGQIAALTNFWSRASTTVSLATSTDILNLGTPAFTPGKLNVGGGSSGGSIVNSLSAGYRLLLHFDGVSGSRKILDAGSYATPIYSRGTQYYNPPVISSVQSKFSGTSLLLDGTNYIEAASRFSIGAGDFSFDFHIRFTSVSGTQTIVDWGGAASGLVLSYSAGTWTFNVAGTACTFSNTPVTNTWYHIAVSRSTNSVRFWVDGAKTGTTQTAAGSITATNTANMFIGATSAGANRASCYLDEFRVITGSSPYFTDAAITVPTTAYEPGGVRLAVDATSRIPDNYVMAADGSGSFMPQRPPRLQVATFCLGESVANTTKYFYSDRCLGTTQDDAQRSGNGSGMSFANACSPIFAGFTGRIVSAVLTVSGVGVNNGSVTAPVVYRADLFRVGFTAEHDPNINGGAAVQLNFSLPTTATVGTFSVGNTRERVVLQDLNIPVFAGDPLALKFINGSGASAAAMTMMAFVTLVIEETF